MATRRHMRTGWLVASVALSLGAHAQEEGADSGTPSIIIHQAGGERETSDKDESRVVITNARSLQRQLDEAENRQARIERALHEAVARLAAAKEVADERAGQVREAEKQAVSATDQLRQERRLRERATTDQERLAAEAAQLRERVASMTALIEEKDRQIAALNRHVSEQTQGEGLSVVAAPEETPQSLLSRADTLAADGEYEEAAALYRDGQAKWPDVSAFRLGIATCHFEQGAPDVAESIVAYVLDEDRNSAGAHGLRGRILWQREDLRGATRSFERAIRLEQDNDRLRIYYGMVLYARGKQREARRELENAIRLNSGDGLAQFNLAVLLAQGTQEDVAQALTYYQESMRLGIDPDPILEGILYPK